MASIRRQLKNRTGFRPSEYGMGTKAKKFCLLGAGERGGYHSQGKVLSPERGTEPKKPSGD